MGTTMKERGSGVHPTADVRTAPLFIDWAKPRKADGTTKGLAIAGPGVKPQRISLDDLYEKFPSPRALYVEGAPTIWRDALIDQSYEVFYCNTLQLASIRRSRDSEEALAAASDPAPGGDSSQGGGSDVRPTAGRDMAAPSSNADASDELANAVLPPGVRASKGDLKDAADLFRYADQIRWYRAVRTEPYVVEAQRLFKNRDLVLGLSKFAAQHASSDTYRDTRFFEETQTLIERRLKEAQRAIEKFCRTSKLHQYHTGDGSELGPTAVTLATVPVILTEGSGSVAVLTVGVPPAAPLTYGISCLTAVAALARRPWLFGRGGWRHYCGVTDHAWTGRAQYRSAGCDATLKRLIHGGVQNLLKETSPYRPLYDAQKIRFETIVKHGRPGHGSVKVTPHHKALNRVTTKVVDAVGEIVRAWYRVYGGGSVTTLTADTRPAAPASLSPPTGSVARLTADGTTAPGGDTQGGGSGPELTAVDVKAASDSLSPPAGSGPAPTADVAAAPSGDF